MPIHSSGSLTVMPDRAIDSSAVPPNAIGRPGNTTGREVISSWSLAKVTTDPENETDPTTIVKAVAARVNHPGSPPNSVIS